MNDWQKEHELRGQLALQALRRAVDKAYADGTALVLEEQAPEAPAQELKAA